MKPMKHFDRLLSCCGLVRKNAPVGESYHDVVVIVNGMEYPFNGGNYALELTLSRAGGWNLWNKWHGKSTRIGGEYNGDYFTIKVNGRVICHSEPEDEEHRAIANARVKAGVPALPGWNGGVVNKPVY